MNKLSNNIYFNGFSSEIVKDYSSTMIKVYFSVNL